MSDHICGFYYMVPDAPGYGRPRRRYLPQVALDAHTTILSTLSRTTLTQTFVNDDDDALPEIRYAFPLYDGVSVVGFECRVGRRVIRGTVRERQAARAVYDAAQARGEVAGLLEQLPSASDVFTTTVGNVPARAELRVVVTYLGELKHDAQVDGVRFTLPARIAPRYGHYPGELKATAMPPPLGPDQPGMRVVVDIDLADSGAQLTSVQSPSHQTAVTLGRVSTAPATTALSFQRASTTLALGTAELDCDFVLQVVATQAGTPSAVLETHPTLPNQRALMATLVPRFSLPAEPRPEVVFVCDRSGSMRGKIVDLQAALRLFVKALMPGARFNLCSFGSRHSFLWERSAPYTRESAQEALAHIETFDANYGGTEIHDALKDTFERRQAEANLEVFLLTDGEVWNHGQLFAMVREHVAASKGAARLFTLGIGTAVSHALVEGLARAGNGFAQTISKSEDMTAKVGRMLKGATFPRVTDYTLEVQYADDDEDDEPQDEAEADSFEMVDEATNDDDAPAVATPDSEATMKDEAPAQPQAPISLFDPTASLDAPAPSDAEKWDAKNRFAHLPALDSPAILQTPCEIPALFPFHRTTVYLLLSADAPRKRPKAVVLRGTSRHGPLELAMAVAALPEPGQTVHQLAAKRAVAELEEGGGWVRQTAAAAAGDGPELAEREGVRLSERFQVASRWASFVAVEETDDQDGDGATARAAQAPPPEPEAKKRTSKPKVRMRTLPPGANSVRPMSASPSLALQSLDSSTSGPPVSTSRTNQLPRASTSGLPPRRQLASKAARMASGREAGPPPPNAMSPADYQRRFQRLGMGRSPASPDQQHTPLADYQTGLMLNEQQNKKRLAMLSQPQMQQRQQTQQMQQMQQMQPMNSAPSFPPPPVAQASLPPGSGRDPSPDFAGPFVSNVALEDIDFANPLQSNDVLNDFDFDAFLHDGNNNDGGFDFSGGTFSMPPDANVDRAASALPPPPPPSGPARISATGDPAQVEKKKKRAQPSPEQRHRQQQQQALRTPATPAERLQALVHLQDFDGFWPWAAALRTAIGWDDDALRQRYGPAATGTAAAADAAATAAVVEWLRTERAADRDTWELLVDKAVDWLRRQDRDLLASLGLLEMAGLA